MTAVADGPPEPAGTAAGRHGSEKFRRIAAAGIILRCLAGSGLHGTIVGDRADRDELGICIEPVEWVAGVRGFPEATPLSPDGPFEQYISRSQPEGARSGPGDVDLTVWGLRKWMRLALGGSPTGLLPLFAPETAMISMTRLGAELQALAPAIVSRQAARRFAGYLDRQRKLMLSRDGVRPDLVERHGYDVKYAGHMVRLGYQGAELLETGRITLPMPEGEGETIRAIRAGRHTMSETLALAADLEARILELAETSPLPPRPDYAKADAWMSSTYLRAWAGWAS